MNDIHDFAVPPSDSDELDVFSGDPDFMLSLARGLLIFRAFADKREKLTVAQISSATGLKRSTAYRCLYTLTKLGYLESEGSKFAPRISTLLLGCAYFARGHWEAALQPILDGLRDRVGMTCGLGVYEEGYVHYVVVSQSRGSLTLVASVGRRLPAYCTAVGRIFLADMKADVLERYLDGLSAVSHTQYTTTERAKLLSRIDDTRVQNHAVASQEIDLGVRVAAVPVRSDSGEIVAALMSGGEISVMSGDKIDSLFLPELHKVATEIGRLWEGFDRPRSRPALG